jgi:Major Facilitator Superfamily
MKLINSKWSALFTSNFLGVLNDNLLKNCLIFMAVTWSLPPWLTQSQLISIFSSCLVLPYIFFSPLSGRLAVIYSKQKVYQIFKLIEIPTMVVACIAFYFQWIILAIVVILIMGIFACLYSPSKYGLIRDIGGDSGISYGSSVFELLVFMGILLGTVAGSILSEVHHVWIIYYFFLGLALLGYYAARQLKVNEIPEDKSNNGSLNPIPFFIQSIKEASKYELVGSGIFGASVFWLIGSLIQMNLLIHCKHIYHTSNTVTGLVMGSAAVGIAAGCWAVGKISGNALKIGLILIGIIGMSVLSLVVTIFYFPLPVFVILIFAIAFLGGVFQIPCLALVQDGKLGRKIGDMIAFLNFNTFGFVLLGAITFSITTGITHENSIAVFGVISLICIVVSLIFLFISPQYRKATMAMLFKK